MKIISHRGNIFGPNKELENSLDYIEVAMSLGFDVEVDLWCKNNNLFLGHDKPVYKITKDWLLMNKDRLFIHCKHIDSLLYMHSCSNDYFHYFWHETDTVTLTSLGCIWAYPGKQPIKNSIAVMPEINNDDVMHCFGICTDYPVRYRSLCTDGLRG